MNISYFRKSTVSKDTAIKRVKTHAVTHGLTIVGETSVSGGKHTVLHLSNPVWLGNILATDMNLIGMLPLAVVVLEKNHDVLVGVGNASVLGSITQDPAVRKLASEVERILTEIVHNAAGVGPRKPKEVKLYSTTTCPYCKMEASWFDSHKIQYKEVKVDTNQAEAEIMVKKTGQMGVPVTEIQYEGGDEEYIIGFDQGKLAQILGVA